MVRFMIAICIFMACFVVAKPEETPSSAPSPSPATSCFSIIYDMTDCISFISERSKDKKPTLSCCSGVKTVLGVDPKCICEALKSSAQLGIDVNLTRAATLPSACGVSAPPINKCDVSSSPATAPGTSPGNAPGPSPGTAPSPSLGAPPGTSPGTAPVPPPTTAPAKQPSPPPSNGAPSPNSAEAPAPVGVPGSSNNTPPPSPDGEGDAEPAPAPAVSSGTYSLSACFFALIISMLVASFSYVSV